LIELKTVLPDGTAARLGLEPGDTIVSINGKEISDVIDYRFFAADERLVTLVRNKTGKTRRLIISKDPDDMMGLEFNPFPVKRCRNRCIFCFVDQMPPLCRKSLSVKDDDYRASFQYGNYITLGNLTTADWDRIFTQRLSPLYISVHATDPGLRSSLLRNSKAPDIMTSLKRLADHGIRMHTQLVLCPEINDGDHLVKTIEELSSLFPAIMSIAAVPVGFTKWRKGLYPLKQFTPSRARAVIDTVEKFGKGFKRRFGTRLVYASDELYIKSGKQFPAASFYEDFPQIENGVGMVADFLREASRTRLPKVTRPVTATVVTGASFSKVLKSVLRRLENVRGVDLRTVIVKNDFFGNTVTVAGLLTGRDIVKTLRGKKLGDIVMLPSNMLKDDEDVFLDNMSLAQLEQALRTSAYKVDGFGDMVSVLSGMRRKEQ